MSDENDPTGATEGLVVEHLDGEVHPKERLLGRTAIQFPLVLAIVLFGISRKSPELAEGLLHGELASYGAFAIATGVVAAGFWWLNRRDRRKRRVRDALRAEAPPPMAHSSGPEADATSAHPESPTENAPAAANPSVAFQLALRAVTPRLWVVPGLILLNVAVYGVMVLSGVAPFSPQAGALVAWGADYGPASLGGEPWRLLTSTFLHFGLIHLLMNMVVLGDAGPIVERLYGHVRFLALYLAAGLCGSLASLAVHPQAVGAGASGAVFGVYGALGAFLLREGKAIPTPELLRLSRVAGAFIGYNLLFGLSHAEIDAAAHVGGLLAGAGAGALLARPLNPARLPSPLRPVAVTAGVLGLVAAALMLLPKPADLGATLERFSSDTGRVSDTFNDLLAQMRKGTLGSQAFAAQVQDRVLVPWRKARERLLRPQRWSPEQQQFLDSLLKYSTTQEGAWTSLVTGLRQHDEKALAQARALNAEAEQLLKDLNRQGP